MSSKQIAPVTAGFEALKLTNEYNAEYWSARDLQPLLGYSQWRRFEQAIERATASCEVSGNKAQHHFAGAGKPITGGKGAVQLVDDYHLSRFACYLIAQNGDPRKPEIAHAQQYFAVQTRRQELSDQAAADVERLELRKQTAEEGKARELADLQDVMKAQDVKLAEAQKAQAELIKKQRELDDAKRELDLTIEKRVQDGLTEVRTQAKREAEDGMRLKVAEKDQAIASMQQKIEELKQKAEQGSQQLQGEVLELELEHLLRSKFPFDLIEPVPKGEFGGDALHRINSPSGMACGSILWESKRTRNWSDSWLAKLREDQRTAQAEVCVLVSQALPKGIETFDLVDGVWITAPRAVIPVAALSDEVGADRSLLVCCGAYRGVTAAQASERWPNLTIKKIPKMVKNRCEWGHDDYSLNVANLPMAQKQVDAPAQDDLFGLNSDPVHRNSDGAGQPELAE
jgi:hypothetical protein